MKDYNDEFFVGDLGCIIPETVGTKVAADDKIIIDKCKATFTIFTQKGKEIAIPIESWQYTPLKSWESEVRFIWSSIPAGIPKAKDITAEELGFNSDFNLSDINVPSEETTCKCDLAAMQQSGPLGPDGKCNLCGKK